jgi:predicted DNA-binding protein
MRPRKDPSEIRDIQLKLMVNENTDTLLEAMSKFSGKRKATFIHEIVLSYLKEVSGESIKQSAA